MHENNCPYLNPDCPQCNPKFVAPSPTVPTKPAQGRWAKWNLNYNVRVRLTEAGVNRYRERHPSGADPVICDAGWFCCKMTDLMSTFGDMMVIGGPLPFSCHVELDLPIDRTIQEQVRDAAEEALFGD